MKILFHKVGAMLNINQTLENYRIESILSERIHVTSAETHEPMAFLLGYTMPVRIATVLLIWAKVGGAPYKRYMSDKDKLEMQQFNKHVPEFKDLEYMIDKIRYSICDRGSQWIDENIEELLKY